MRDTASPIFLFNLIALIVFGWVQIMKPLVHYDSLASISSVTSSSLRVS
jgi:hypothetical protein